jgi:proteic killer suppression protein
MIQSYRSKALKLFAEKGDSSKLQQHHVGRLRLLLGRLNLAENPEMMIQPGYKFHSLTGQQLGYYAVSVNGNWRVTFRFEDGHAHDVDYLDYH